MLNIATWSTSQFLIIQRIQGTYRHTLHMIECDCILLRYECGLAGRDVYAMPVCLPKCQRRPGSSPHSDVYFLNKLMFGLTSVGREYLRNPGRKLDGKQRKSEQGTLTLFCFCLWLKNEQHLAPSQSDVQEAGGRQVEWDKWVVIANIGKVE